MKARIMMLSLVVLMTGLALMPSTAGALTKKATPSPTLPQTEPGGREACGQFQGRVLAVVPTDKAVDTFLRKVSGDSIPKGKWVVQADASNAQGVQICGIAALSGNGLDSGSLLVGIMVGLLPGVAIFCYMTGKKRTLRIARW